jgi:hypothetical protein
MEINMWSKILKLFINRRSMLISSPLIFFGTKKRFEFCLWFFIINRKLRLNLNIGSWWIEW